MAWNVEQAGDAQQSTSTSYDVALPADHEVGDRIVLNVGCSLVTGDAIAWPDDWQVISEGAVPSSTLRQFVRYHDIDGSEPWYHDDAPAITLSGASNHGWSHTAHVIRGGAGTAPEAGAVGAANDSSPDPGEVQPSWGAKDTLFLALTVHVGTRFITGTPTDYGDPLAFSWNNSSGSGAASAYRTANVASEDPDPFTLNGGTFHRALVVAFEPAATDPDPEPGPDVDVDLTVVPTVQVSAVTGLAVTQKDPPGPVQGGTRSQLPTNPVRILPMGR